MVPFARSLVRRLSSAAAVLVVGYLLSAGTARAGEPSARLISFQPPAGDLVYALSLQAGDLPAVTGTTEHVLLVDTSASQAGAHRKQGLGVLEGYLARLGKSDVVSLYAVDSDVKPMTKGFVPAGSAELKSAVVAIKRRIPLGASNLMPALRSAMNGATAESRRVVTYIGDGMSTSQLIDPATMRTYVEECRDARVVVSAYAVGPRTDLVLLGILAHQTGGVLMIDEVIDDTRSTAKDLGADLAVAQAQPVLYVKGLLGKPELTNLLPAAVPPLRSDRTTVLLGRGALPEQLAVEVAGTVGSVRQTINWQLDRPEPLAINAFLGGLRSMAEADRGLSVPTAGDDLLLLARNEHEKSVSGMVELAKQALLRKDLKSAEELAWAAKNADPSDREAKALVRETAIARAAGVAVTEASDETLVVAQADAAEAPEASEPGTEAPAAEAPAEDATPAAPEPGDVGATDEMPAPAEALADDAPMPAAPAPGDLLDRERELRSLRGEALRREVNSLLDSVRNVMNEDPDAALAEVKRMLSTVDSALDVDPAIRSNLRSRLARMRDAVAGRRTTLEEERIRRAEREAAIRAQRNLVDLTVQRERRLEQLIDRVRSLLTEGFLGNELAFEEAEAVSRAAWELSPYSGVTAAAIFDSEAAGQLDKAERLRYLRADKFLETLYQVELSHVPFPDEPPVLWPAAEVWQAITKRRKKWASVDLKKYDKKEEAIRAMLDEPVECDFTEIPLREAITSLKDQLRGKTRRPGDEPEDDLTAEEERRLQEELRQGVNIWFDEKAISDDGTVSLDDPVTLNLSGVSFKTVLKLLLQPRGLTWLIEDQVLKITTQTESDAKLQTRVYPVGDLVIPIQTPMQGGIGQGVGGAGGLGGGGGGLQGGGQFGGGQQGGGGGGAGFFQVADDAPKAFDNKAVLERKKKLQ
jgi:uncharacterized membrane protein YgcG